MKDSSSSIPSSSITGSQSGLTEIKKWRPVFYKLAWLGFSYPDEQIFNRLEVKSFLEGMIETSSVYGIDMREEIEKEKNKLRKKDQDQFLKELETEYVRLFIAEVGGALIQPYGSVYIDGEVRGQSTEKVVEKYSRTGFEKSDEYSDLPDHFSTELEYLYRLSQRDDSKSLAQYRVFYDECFAPWYDDFTADVRNETEHWFYDLLARWTSQGLDKDREVVKEILLDREEKQGRVK